VIGRVIVLAANKLSPDWPSLLDWERNRSVAGRDELREKQLKPPTDSIEVESILTSYSPIRALIESCLYGTVEELTRTHLYPATRRYQFW